MRRATVAIALAALVPATALAAFPADPPNDPLYDASPLPNSRQEQWDLILYSWVAAGRSAAKAIEGLKPGGVIVFESSTALIPNKDLVLQWFQPLHVLQHTVERGKSDFFSRQDVDIIRFLAEKPRQ